MRRFFSGKEAPRGLRGRIRRRRRLRRPPVEPRPVERPPLTEPPRFEAPPPPGPPPFEPPPPPAPPAEPEPPPSEPPALFGPPSTYESSLFGPPRSLEAPPAPADAWPSEPAASPEPPRRPRRLRRRRLRRRGRFRGLLGGAAFLLGSAGRALGRGALRLGDLVADSRGAVAGAWAGLDVYVRRRLVLLSLLVAVVAAFFLLAVPALPCQYPGGSTCPPADHAVKLVPGDALVYVHADLDHSTSQYRLASSVAARIPTLSAQLISPFASAVPGTGGIPGFVSDIRPWLGDEAALALLPARGPPQQVDLLAIGDERGARRYQATLEGPGPTTLPYRGIDVERGRRGVASAIVSGFLLIGTEAGLREVIDAATGAKGAPTLAATPAASRVRDQLPANRVADAYLSPAGVAAVAGRTTGLLSSLAPFMAPGATTGAAAALVGGSGRLELEIRSALDPRRAKARPGFFAAFSPFQDTLAPQLPASTLAYLGFGEPGNALTALLGQAGTEEPGLARAFSRLLRRARTTARIDVRRDLLPALGSEAALALEPSPSGVARPGSGRTPYLLYVGGGVNEARARAALARLQRPLLRTLGSGRHGNGPGIVAGNVAGAITESLRVSPILDLTYAVANGLFVLATDPAGIEPVLLPAAGGLGAAGVFGDATSGLGGSPSLLAYLNLRGLIAVGERAGLTANPGYTALAPEIHRLEAVGISVTSAPDELATSARLLVGG